MERKVTEMESLISSKDMNIEILNKKIEVLEKDNNTLMIEKGQDQTLEAKERNRDIEDIQGQLSASNDKLFEAESKSKELQSTIIEQNKNIADLSLVVDTLRKEKTSLERTVEEKDESIGNQKQELVISDDNLLTTKNELKLFVL